MTNLIQPHEEVNGDEHGAGLLRRLACCIDNSANSVTAETAELLSCLSLLGQIGDDTNGAADTTPSPDLASNPGRPAQETLASAFPIEFGRFELRGLLGIGGFGVVFRAFDATLDREVALKIPRPEVAAQPALQARFMREAQAAASLDHPGIVPVFETGRIGPICYISTALCTGPSLSARLHNQSEPVPPRQAVELVRHLADALQHAHDRGVLHRDLKPSNVLLEPRVTEASDLHEYQPRIADFGLAKRLDMTGPHTKEGAVLGTPRYMAPEQVAARGEAVSVQTDVYALGVILYELLAGSPPFVGESDVQTMSMILDTEPAPPRRSGERLDRDLTSICLTCLRKAPTERYPSARALADDLARYLRGEPVIARPLSRGKQAARWCRRRPLVAGLSGALAVLALALFIGSWAMMARERTIRRAAEWKQQFAEQAVDDMYLSIDKWASGKPASEDLRREFLLKALEFYDALAQEHSSDPAAQPRICTALQRMANIQAHLRMPKEAAATRKRCLALLDVLVIEFPDRNDYAFERFQCLLASTYDHAALRDEGSVEIAVEQAYTAMMALLEIEPTNPDYLDAASAVAHVYAGNQYNRGNVGLAVAMWEDVVERAERLAETYPDRPLYRKHIANGLRSLAHHATVEERYEQAAALFGRCADIMKSIADDLPEYYDLRLAEATALVNVAFMECRLHRFDSVAERTAVADEILARLAAEHPHEPDIHGAYCRALWDVGYVLHEEGQAENSKAYLARSVEMARKLVEERPDYLPHREYFVAMLRTCPIPELRDPELAKRLEHDDEYEVRVE